MLDLMIHVTNFHAPPPPKVPHRFAKQPNCDMGSGADILAEQTRLLRDTGNQQKFL
jgi:hypothetical protein